MDSTDSTKSHTYNNNNNNIYDRPPPCNPNYIDDNNNEQEGINSSNIHRRNSYPINPMHYYAATGTNDINNINNIMNQESNPGNDNNRKHLNLKTVYKSFCGTVNKVKKSTLETSASMYITVKDFEQKHELSAKGKKLAA